MCCPVQVGQGFLDSGVMADDSFTPSWVQQLIRAFAYGTQFTVSFLV